jgi:hypothetical protein
LAVRSISLVAQGLLWMNVLIGISKTNKHLKG